MLQAYVYHCVHLLLISNINMTIWFPALDGVQGWRYVTQQVGICLICLYQVMHRFAAEYCLMDTQILTTKQVKSHLFYSNRQENNSINVEKNTSKTKVSLFSSVRFNGESIQSDKSTLQSLSIMN